MLFIVAGMFLVLGFVLGMLVVYKDKAQPGPFAQVKEFHQAYGQPVGKDPYWPNADRMALRLALIDEEVAEFKDAYAQGDLTNAFKELADIQYVVNGAAVEMGGNLDDVFADVHTSNMSKLGEDGKPIYREDGKVLKGPNYQAPDVTSALGM